MRCHRYAGEGFPFAETQLSVTLAPTAGSPRRRQAGVVGGTAGADVSPGMTSPTRVKGDGAAAAEPYPAR